MFFGMGCLILMVGCECIGVFLMCFFVGDLVWMGDVYVSVGC